MYPVAVIIINFEQPLSEVTIYKPKCIYNIYENIQSILSKFKG